MLQQMKDIKEAIPDAEVEEEVGRRSSFEVTVDGKYIAFSKVATGAFPDYKALAKTIAEYAKSGKAPADWKAKQ